MPSAGAGASPRHRALIHLQKPLLLTTLILLALTVGLTPTATAVETPTFEQWVRYLDPLVETPDEWRGAEAPDGDLGIIYDATNPKFARSPDGSATFVKSTIDATKTGVTNLAIIGLESNVWRVLFSDSTNHWFVYESTNDGSTWTQIQDTNQATTTISVQQTSTHTHVVLVASDNSIRYYRSPDGLASFDRTNIQIRALDADNVLAQIVAWNSNQLEIWYQDGSTSPVRFVSEDAGSFWGDGVGGCCGGFTSVVAGFSVEIDETASSMMVVARGAISSTHKLGSNLYSEWNDATPVSDPISTTNNDNNCTACVVYYDSLGHTTLGGSLIVGAPSNTVKYFARSTGDTKWTQVLAGSLPSGFPATVTGQSQTLEGADRRYTLLRNADVSGRFEVHVLGLVAASATLSENWCSNPAIVDFGYNYVEGVTYFDDAFNAGAAGTGGSDLTDGFEMVAESDNFAYLGKGWATPGSDYAKSIFRIEADSEARSSFFRSTFSFITDTPDATSKGNGLNTESFTDTIEAHFEETGSFWTVSLYFTNAGVGPTKVGSSISFPYNPNTPRTLSFTVNTQGDGYALIYDEEGDQLILNQTLLGSGYPGLAAFGGNDPMYAHWFVAEGSNSILNSYTFLDDSDDAAPNDEDSTCLFFDQSTQGGVEITGDLGLQPPSIGNFTTTASPTVAPGFDDLAEDFGSVFGGIGAEGGAIFLAIFWILVFAAGAYGILGGSPLAIGIGALCGFIFSIFTGLIPDILVFIVVLLAGAAVGMRLFAGGGSGADG